MKSARVASLGLVVVLGLGPLLAGCGGSGSSGRPDRTLSPSFSRTASPPTAPEPTRTRVTRTPDQTSAPETSEPQRPTRTAEPTTEPTQEPTTEPTRERTKEPTTEPTKQKTKEPTQEPTEEPTKKKSKKPTAEPTPTAVATTPPATTAPTPTAESSDSDSTPWGWIILLVLLVVGLVVSLLLLARRRRWAAWRRRGRPIVDAAIVSKDLLPAHGRDITDVAHWESVRAGAEMSATDLKALAADAPSSEAATVAQTSAEALTGLTFALESARLMQGAQPAPTAAQLAEADAAVRARRTELDAALAQLDTLVGPPPPEPAPDQS